MTSSIDLCVIQEAETSLRLDKLLSMRFPTYSRTYFQTLIADECVLVDGKKIKKREKLAAGQEVEICFQLTPEISLEPENIPLDILYEDTHFLAINKPAGMVVHPAPGHFSHTFANALIYHCDQLPNEGLRPGIVHRLDKDTSGVLLAAKTTEAHRNLIDLFSQRKIVKHYLAVCVGNPGDGLINAPIGRHPIHRKKMAVLEQGGREALSRCRVLKQQGLLTLVEIDLMTGRTHQIRVHLKHRNAPVLGDALYGISSVNEKYGITRQLLHAHRVQLPHPITHQPIEIYAPLPADIRDFISIEALD